MTMRTPILVEVDGQHLCSWCWMACASTHPVGDPWTCPVCLTTYQQVRDGAEGTPAPDEAARELWEAFGPGTANPTPRDAGQALGIPAERVEYLCLVWDHAGCYDYGVSIDLGWKTTQVRCATTALSPWQRGSWDKEYDDDED